MPHDVIMPALGMAQDTGVLVAWHKAAGDAVAKGDVLFEVETDKATMEVEAQADGFLTHVSASDGDEIPVGHVIARIGDSADDTSSAPEPVADAPAAKSAASDLPEGTIVIMPTLGMAQDSGVLVAWAIAPGDAVREGDTLFEVETDKSTVEVPAACDGYLAAVLAQAGEDIPTGQTIAIITADKPAAPISRSASEAAAPAEAPTASQAVAQAAPEPAAPSAPEPVPARAEQPALSEAGRVFASPKLRRIAAQEGLDLTALAKTGHPQPFHMADLEALRAANVAPAAAPVAAASCRITAHVASDGFDGFAAWAAEQGLGDSKALLAGLAAGALGRAATVCVETLFAQTTYMAPLGALGSVSLAEADAPDLVLRDLRRSSVQSVELGSEECPVLSLIAQGEGTQLVLEYAPHHFAARDALRFITHFSDRLGQPLRHIL